MFQFWVMYWDRDDNLMKKELQEIPSDNKYHWSKVVKN